MPDPMLGRTIHEFRIEKKLAEGGMGAVYLARHVLLSNTLKVIKVLLPEYAEHGVIRQRFHREAEAASKLQHDSILGIDNFGSLDNGQLFIMVPFLDGQPLDAYLRSRGGRLAPHRALHLIVQLCDALDHAHGLGIIHRDLKPGNVFVIATNTNPYALKLLDFGIAKILGDQDSGLRTHGGVAIGTPSYMAVEQWEHADQVTHLADVYSLAIVIWEMVTGSLPWRHADPALLYYQQRTVIPSRPPASEMPPEWADILLAALSVAPAARPQSVRELAIALASALPAVGLVPSGAEILASLAPRFVRQAAPGDETVRNAAEINRLGPLLWPPRETLPAPAPAPDPAPAPAPAPAPPPEVRTVPAARMRAPAAPMPEAADGASAAGATTLSVATSIMGRVADRRSARWKLALTATAALVPIALVIGWLTASVSPKGSPAPAPDAPPPRVELPPSRGMTAVQQRTPPPGEVPAKAAAVTTTATTHQVQVQNQGSERAAGAAPARPPPAAASPHQPGVAPPRPASTSTGTTAGTGTLLITAAPFADVAVDGRPRGTTPLSLELPPRKYRVTLTGPNSEVKTQTVEVVNAHETKVFQKW